MFVVAVTGGIGAGKTEAARYFASKGALVIDLDLIARALVTSPGPVRDKVVDAFGTAIVREDGSIDTAMLAQLAFGDQESKQTLDRIVHPAVTGEVARGIADLQLLEHPPRVVVIDVPLLTDAPALAEFADAVLAIEAPADLRVQRCVERGMGEEDCRRRMERQASDEERAGLADAVIVNDGSAETFHERLDAFWEREVAPDAS